MKKWLLLFSLLGVSPQTQPVAIVGPNTTQVCTNVCCGNNATALPALNLYGRAGELVQNQSAAAIYIGSAAATDAGMGIILAQNQTFAGSIGWNIQLYCQQSGAGQQGDAGCTEICEYLY